MIRFSLYGQPETRPDPEAGPKGILMLAYRHYQVGTRFEALAFLYPRYTQVGFNSISVLVFPSPHHYWSLFSESSPSHNRFWSLFGYPLPFPRKNDVINGLMDHAKNPGKNIFKPVSFAQLHAVSQCYVMLYHHTSFHHLGILDIERCEVRLLRAC